MDKDRDLLAWILGGLLIATGAVAIVVRSTRSTAPANSQAVSQATHSTTVDTILTPAPAPALASMPAPNAPATPASHAQAVNLPPPVPAGQIWECRINGQKAFSSSPCGGESSVRQIGPINRMDSTPILQQTRSYEPDSSYRAPYPYSSEPQDSNPGDYGDDSYPAFIGIPFQAHRKPDREHRPRGQRPRLDTDAIGPSSGPHAPKTR
jgi:hypothetical protein